MAKSAAPSGLYSKSNTVAQKWKQRSAIPFVFILALIIALFFSQFDNIRIPHFGMSGASSALPWAYTGSTDGARNPKPRFAFSSVTGFFLQDDPATDDNGFEYTKASLGLIDRTYETDKDFDPDHQKTQWERFANYVARLNKSSSHDVKYKILYLGRHGQGDHNVAEAKYGRIEWDRYWSKLPGDGKTNWTDAHLTKVGIAQARTANAFWKKEISTKKIPPPQRYYTSPLHRCLATANLTFGDLELYDEQPYVPEVKEMLRETLGEHTCDMRSSRTYIHEQFPAYAIEPSLTENDELWKADIRETDDEVAARLSILLDDIFDTDQSTFISLTAHSGAITGALQAIGHRKFGLQTGGVIAVFVKAQKIYD